MSTFETGGESKENAGNTGSQHGVSNIIISISPTEMIRNLGWDSLKQRRAKIRLATLYKIMFNLVEIPREQFLIPTTSTYQSHCLNFQRPTTTTNYLKYSFFPRTIAQWNSLPYAIQSSPTLEGFKSLINEASIPDLKC